MPCVCHLRFSRSFVRNVVNCHSSVLPLSPLSFPVVEAIGCSVALLFIMCKLYCFGLKDCLTEADGFRRQSVSVCQRRTALRFPQAECVVYDYWLLPSSELDDVVQSSTVLFSDFRRVVGQCCELDG